MLILFQQTERDSVDAHPRTHKKLSPTKKVTQAKYIKQNVLLFTERIIQLDTEQISETKNVARMKYT